MDEEEYHALEQRWKEYVSTLGGRGWSLTYSQLSPWQQIYVAERDRKYGLKLPSNAEGLTDEDSLVRLLRTII